jgi:putative DNA primase/helicase
MEATMDHVLIEKWIWFYYDTCGFSIIPLGANPKYEQSLDKLKKPSIDTWEQYHKKRATREQIQQWIDEKLFTNIGVICGAVSGNLVILDIDDESIPELLQIKWDKIYETKAWGARTGKGYQIWMKHNTNPGGIKKPLRYKIEYRANRGYCAVPPSTHPNGNKYYFIDHETPESLPDIIITDVQLMFKEMKKKIGEKWGLKEKHGEPKPKNGHSTDFPGCIEIALTTITKQGMRYYTLYGISSAFYFKGIPYDMALKRIKQFNMEKCVPPHHNMIVEQAVRGAYQEDAHRYGCEFWMDDAELCPYEDIMECEYGKKKAKRELIKQYHVFKYTEKTNKETGETIYIPSDVNPPRLAKLLMNEYTFNFKTIRDTQEIYYYNDGIYHSDGETIIASLAEEYMDDLTTTHKKNEVIGYIKDSNYIDREKFNINPDFINLKNGIYNIKTKEFIGHNPSFLFINEIPVDYDKEAKCPKILKFLSEVIYPEDITTLQEFFGYCLYRKHHIHKSCMFIGEGKNGKSTTINLLGALLGNKNICSRELYQLINDKFAVADLYGKLANLAADITATALKQTGLFKALTGEDLVTAEKKFKGGFSFRNYAKFIFSANKLPRSPDKSYAFYRRWILISFPNTFVGKQCNSNLINEITTPDELSGLLNWALEGLERLLEQGDFSYNKTVEEVAEQYETLSNPVYSFVKKFLKPLVGGCLLKDDVWEKYVKWCKEKKISVVPRNMLTRELSKHLPEMRSDRTTMLVDGKQMPAYREITWQDESDVILYDEICGVAKNESLEEYV